MIRARIFFTGVGGQGTLLATRLVGEAALAEGLPVTMSEIHGMAQRGGVVESSVVLGSAHSPTIADGEADILLAFEPLEAARALPKCHAGTLALVALDPVAPFTVATGKADYPDIPALLAAVEKAVARCIRVAANSLARNAGNERAANVALIGVLVMADPLAGESTWRQGMIAYDDRLLKEANPMPGETWTEFYENLARDWPGFAEAMDDFKRTQGLWEGDDNGQPWSFHSAALRAAGFVEPEILYRHGRLGVFGAVKG